MRKFHCWYACRPRRFIQRPGRGVLRSTLPRSGWRLTSAMPKWRRPLPAPRRLTEYCRERRLHPLADLLEEPFGLQAPDAERVEEDARIIECVFELLERAARRMERRVCLLIDAPENAVWAGSDGERFYAYAPPVEEDGWVRRIWTLRMESAEAHPFLVPPPPGAELWEVPLLSEKTALGFFHHQARAHRLDYDRQALADYLPLSGATPRLLANFVRSLRSSPMRWSRPMRFCRCM